jgi:hypothetical protein
MSLSILTYMCYRGGCPNSSQKIAPRGGDGNGQQGGRGYASCPLAQGMKVRRLLWGIFIEDSLGRDESAMGGGGPEYPRVTNKVFPALSHGWWSIIF